MILLDGFIPTEYSAKRSTTETEDHYERVPLDFLHIGEACHADKNKCKIKNTFQMIQNERFIICTAHPNTWHNSILVQNSLNKTERDISSQASSSSRPS